MKRRRRYANNRVRVLVQLHRLAHHARIILKMAVPECVTQHDVRCAVLAVLIRGVKHAPHVRLHSQRVEVVAASFVNPHRSRIFSCVKACLRDVECRQALEAAVTISQVEIVRIRLVSRATFVLDSVEAVRLGQIQRTQDKRVEHCKHQRVRANAQRQRYYRHQREARRLAQHAHREPQVLSHRLHKRSARLFVTLLFYPRIAAELDARPSLCLGPRQT